MNFRSEFFPKAFPKKISHKDNLLLIGSCFTEQIGGKLAIHKFNVLENPNGILFNPVSISTAINSYVNQKMYHENDLFYYNELWASKNHHTKFSSPDKINTLEKINESQSKAIGFIKKSDWIIITLGSSFIYEFKDIIADVDYNNVAANCHKIPTDKFNKRLMPANEIIGVLSAMQQKIWTINSNAKFIYTISPVRHLRDGFIENNKSKANLIQAVHELVNDENCFYFPSYELIIDDLRDYRFFAEDLVHPNYSATNYVWEKFVPVVVDESAQEIMQKINELNAAISHKPFNPTSDAHKKFLQVNYKKAESLSIKYPHINFQQYLDFFSS